jgi:WD40 repeat protein
MSSEHLNEASIFNTARKIESGDERSVFLSEACGSDSALRQRVETLLTSYEEESQFLEQSAACLDATASLEAGLAPTLGHQAAVVIGDANHSVLRSFEQTVDPPRVSLRDAKEEGADPVPRLNSLEIPDHNADSRYRIDGEIARGGMGAILKGRDTDLGRDLAIKVLLDSHKNKPEMIQRFIEEAQIGGQLQHPGIAPVYELGQFSDQRPFFSMKLVKGETLSELLAARGDPLDDQATLLGIFEQMCQTMAYAHSRGVIHRDLKPANIMVGAFGEVQVMDWGLAKVLSAGGVADEKKAYTKHQDVSIIQTMRNVGSETQGRFGSHGSETQIGSVMGTPAYMPPEQALGEIDRLDERSDVFGLGAILCEILTGKPPYVGSDSTQVFRQASRGKLDGCFARLAACGGEQELIDLAKQMLAVEPEDRLRNAGAVAEAITKHLNGVQDRLKQAELAGAEANARAEELARRRKLHVAMAGLMLLIALGTGISATVYRQQREVQAGLADRNAELAKENEEKRQVAELAQERIAIEKKNVEQQKDRAVESEAAAVALQKTLQRELYIADMQQVRQAYHEGASNRVASLLEKYVPGQGKLDLRGWEWFYWKRVSQLHTQQFEYLHPLKGMAVSPDRTWIAVRGWPNDVFILDAKTLQRISKFEAGETDHPGTEFAISPDGSFFACISGRSVKLWRTDDWSSLPALKHERDLRAIAFSAAGLLAAADPEGRITFWDVTQNVEQGEPLETDLSLNGLAFSPLGNRLVTSHPTAGNDPAHSLVVWQVDTRRRLVKLIDNSQAVTALAWSARGDRSLIAAGFADGIVRTWEGTSYADRDSLVAGGSVRALSFSPRGSKLIAGTARNNAVVLWDTGTARRISEIKGHFRVVRGVAFAGDGQSVWSCSEDGTLKTWNLSNSDPFTRVTSDIPIPGRVKLSDHKPEDRTAFSDSRRFLAVYKPEGEFENRLQVWRMDASDPVLLSEHVLFDDAQSEPPRALLISDDGSVVAWLRERILVLFHLSTGKQTSGSFVDGVAHLALSHDGKLIAEHNKWNARLWDVSSGAPENRINLEGFPAFRLKFSPDGKFLALALLNNDVQLHDAATGEILHRFQGHAGAVTAIDFSPDSILLVSGGVDGTVRLWDVSHRSLLVTFSPHDQPISSVTFSTDGQIIQSTSTDGDTRLWRGGTESN